jgi:2-iminobutanoate/2-iminopropanoate deaminase
MSKVERIQTRAAPQPRGHYSQAVRAGNLLFISGQLPLDAAGRLVEGTIGVQALQALKNVRAIVEEAGGAVSDLVQCTLYVSDIDQWAEVDRVYGEFLAGVSVLPARAVVPVKTLHHGAQIEVQAIAVLPPQ